jgi:hypothetical protein
MIHSRLRGKSITSLLLKYRDFLIDSLWGGRYHRRILGEGSGARLLEMRGDLNAEIYCSWRGGRFTGR